MKTYTRDGYNVSIEYVNDDHPDTSYLGEFTDHWSTGCVDRKRTGYYERGQYRYFRFGSGCENYARAAAKGREYLADWTRSSYEDYQRMEKLNAGGWSYVGVIVRVSKQEIALGYASLWGVESDSPAAHMRCIEAELLAEAIDEAEAKSVAV